MTITNEKSRAMLAPRFFKERDVANYLGVSVFTLQRWRQKGIGPAFVKLAMPDSRTSPVRYEQATVEEWANSQKTMSGTTREVLSA